MMPSRQASRESLCRFSNHQSSIVHRAASIVSGFSTSPSTLGEADARPLKGIVGRYEGTDGRCRHEILRDIFLLAPRICAVRVHRDFPAHDAEKTFASGIEHAGP